MKIIKDKIIRRNYFISLLVMGIIMLIFNNSFYWVDGISKKRIILERAIVLFGIIVVPLCIAEIPCLCRIMNSIIDSCKKKVELLLENRKSFLITITFILGSVVISYVLTLGISKYKHVDFNIYDFYLLIAVLWIILAVVKSVKKVEEYPEKFFFILIMIIGIFFIRVSPPIVGISWDDEIHYARTLSISNSLNGLMYESEDKVITEYATNIINHLYYDKDSQYQYVSELQAMNDRNECKIYKFTDFGVWSIAYVPSAIGIILGRGLNLTYPHVFMLGKFFNLLMYALLFYFAIRRIRYGKILIACIGLIPTSVFMATSYAYDPWVIGFTVLGFSYYFGALQEPEHRFTTKELVIMLGALTLGCLPKAIYFPLLFPLLFLAKKQFVSKKQRKLFYIFIIIAGVFLMATFLLPMLVAGAGSGDVRGGAGVNSTEQIQFILHNPIKYTVILLNFLKEYLAVENSYGYLQYFAYMGNGSFYGIVCVTLYIVAFLDRGMIREKIILPKLSCFVAAIGVAVLVPTALYISYTEVAADTVAGCQFRYITPILFPVLFSLGVDRINNNIRRIWFHMIPMLIIASTFLYNIYMLCASLY